MSENEWKGSDPAKAKQQLKATIHSKIQDTYMIFLIATQNKHKKVEFERILAPLGIEIKTAGELGLQYPDVEETGTTFEENALLKARVQHDEL